MSSDGVHGKKRGQGDRSEKEKLRQIEKITEYQNLCSKIDEKVGFENIFHVDLTDLVK
jgi:hypothetical protein